MIRRLLLILLLMLQQPAPPTNLQIGTGTSSSGNVLLTTFGLVGQGGNDTSTIQSAINSTASAGQTLEIPPGTYATNSLSIPSNTKIQCDGGAVITDFSALSSDLISITGSVSNITITGANPAGTTKSAGSISPNSSDCVFREPTTSASNPSGNGPHVFRIGTGGTVNNISISGVSAISAAGDGFYIREATNITLNNVTASGALRNGCSITGKVNHITVSNSYFANQRNLAVQLIADGCDVEPNVPADFVMDTNFNSNKFENNQLSGLAWQLGNLDGTSNAIGGTQSNNVAVNNGSTISIAGNNDYFLDNYDGTGATSGGPGGSITATNDSSSGSAFAGLAAVWARCSSGPTTVSVSGLSITNAYSLGTTDVHINGTGGVFVREFGAIGAQCPPGGVTFSSTSESNTNGNMQYYFEFDSGNGGNSTGVAFDLAGSLSGRTGSANGLWNGSQVSQVP